MVTGGGGELSIPFSSWKYLGFLENQACSLAPHRLALFWIGLLPLQVGRYYHLRQMEDAKKVNNTKAFNLILGKKTIALIISNIPHSLHPKPFVSTQSNAKKELKPSCLDQWVPRDGKGEECLLSSLQLLILQKKKDFSYSGRKQNDFRLPGSFSVRKQVMRARFYYLSIEFQRVPVSEVSGKESPERILPRDKCKRPPIHNSHLLSNCT